MLARFPPLSLNHLAVEISTTTTRWCVVVKIHLRLSSPFTLASPIFHSVPYNLKEVSHRILKLNYTGKVNGFLYL